jgi:hypothetical protein
MSSFESTIVGLPLQGCLNQRRTVYSGAPHAIQASPGISVGQTTTARRPLVLPLLTGARAVTGYPALHERLLQYPPRRKVRPLQGLVSLRIRLDGPWAGGRD